MKKVLFILSVLVVLFFVSNTVVALDLVLDATLRGDTIVIRINMDNVDADTKLALSLESKAALPARVSIKLDPMKKIMEIVDIGGSNHIGVISTGCITSGKYLLKVKIHSQQKDYVWGMEIAKSRDGTVFLGKFSKLTEA